MFPNNNKRNLQFRSFTSIEINQLTGIYTEHVDLLWIWSLLLSIMMENQKKKTVPNHPNVLLVAVPLIRIGIFEIYFTWIVVYGVWFVNGKPHMNVNIILARGKTNMNEWRPTSKYLMKLKRLFIIKNEYFIQIIIFMYNLDWKMRYFFVWIIITIGLAPIKTNQWKWAYL